VPLERLNVRLKLHVEQLRADLVDIINADYPQFMALSDQLGNVDGAVMRIKAPLLTLQDALAEVQGRYKSELETLEDALQRQSQARLPTGLRGCQPF
jgi:conserved oligomeric Golgi complex subunit 2